MCVHISVWILAEQYDSSAHSLTHGMPMHVQDSKQGQESIVKLSQYSEECSPEGQC